jgi:hypothetical protein
MVMYDEKNHRAGLTVFKGVAGLSLYDGKATERANLQVDNNGPGLRLVDADGKAGFNLWVAPLGGGPDFSMYDSAGKLRVDLVAAMLANVLAYAERDLFHTNEGSPRLIVRLRCASAYAAAFSLPCSMSSTGSEGATQFLALTLYTDACIPSALCSENKRRCSPPTLTSAQTPSSNIVKF